MKPRSSRNRASAVALWTALLALSGQHVAAFSRSPALLLHGRTALLLHGRAPIHCGPSFGGLRMSPAGDKSIREEPEDLDTLESKKKAGDDLLAAKQTSKRDQIENDDELELPVAKKDLPTAKLMDSSPGDDEGSDQENYPLVQPVEPDQAGPIADTVARRRQNSYDLGLGKNRPIGLEEQLEKDDDSSDDADDIEKNAAGDATQHWMAPEPVNEVSPGDAAGAVLAAAAVSFDDDTRTNQFVKTRKMVARDQASQQLRGAIWDEQHYGNNGQEMEQINSLDSQPTAAAASSPIGIKRPQLFYPDIDMSIPLSVYNETYDAIWELLQWEAFQEAQREPLLVSFLYSTILNHPSLESSLAFLLANRLSSPMLISTQLQSFILEALQSSPEFRRAVRADMLAVRDRDPACTCLPDVFLYFKGFQSLQSHRVANWMWRNGKQVLAHFLQSQVSQIWQIDIHPNATVGEGIMLDHGTGIVVGETAMIGNNCSILHHVTLGGSGKKGVDRHPKIQDGVLLGAGATVLGNVLIGEGCQVGAGTLVITDLPAHSVAVGVPAKIIGSFVDVTEQPSNDMNQMISDNMKIATFESFGI